MSLGRAEGLTKLLTEPGTNRILGAGIVGPSAGDLIAEVCLAMEMGADAEDVGLTIHPHPTLSETVAFAAEMAEGTITDLYAPRRRADLAYRRLDEATSSGGPRTRWASRTPTSPSSSRRMQLSARLWRLAPGQASTKHRHRTQEELYVLLEGTGRIRIGDEVLTLEPRASLVVEPDTVRQLFNDTDADQLWLVMGAPPEAREHARDDGGDARLHVSGRPEGDAA